MGNLSLAYLTLPTSTTCPSLLFRPLPLRSEGTQPLQMASSSKKGSSNSPKRTQKGKALASGETQTRNMLPRRPRPPPIRTLVLLFLQSYFLLSWFKPTVLQGRLQYFTYIGTFMERPLWSSMVNCTLLNREINSVRYIELPLAALLITCPLLLWHRTEQSDDP